MPKKTAAQRDAELRAEARRRARLAAQGRLPDESEDEVAAAPARQPSMSFVQRLFPPAAPLPGKPPPLSGFTYVGNLRPIVLAAWLIRRNLYAGIGMGVMWAAAYSLAGLYGRSLVGTIGEFVSFGSLVAAGWIGWRRPWLYGLVAAVTGFVLLNAFYFVYVQPGQPVLPTAGGTLQLAANLVFGLEQAAIGALAGFYGGYLRRRLADPATKQAAAARRRR